MTTITDIDRITGIRHAVIRNLQITQCYHELALILTARTGLCANWCTFATWASKQAGQTIRKEDFARILENRLTAQSVSDLAASAQALGAKANAVEIEESLLEILNPLAALNRASDAVARGNRKVFAEIGREFARFYAECLPDTVYNADTIARFCAELRPGDPPDGQDYLRQAFTGYYRALFEPDPKTRAELMLLANIQIGYHEQTRLQPEIAEAMSAAFVDPRDFQRRVIKALFPSWLVRVRHFCLRLLNRPSPLDPLLDALLAEANRRAHLIITEYGMTLGLPRDVILRLGEDVPAEFPDSLKQIVLPDLCALLEKIDPTPDTPRESGAVLWSDLHDRLHFIIDLFRCYHETADLYDTPFTPEQVAALKAGHVPAGRL